MQTKSMLQRFKKFIDILMSQIKIYYKKATTKYEKKETIIPTSFIRSQTPNDTEYSTPNTDNFHKKRNGSKQKNVRGWIMVVTTAIMAAFTVLLFFIATRQNDATWEALHFQKKSDSLNKIIQQSIADSSINLSKRIAEDQKTFTKLDIRPYLIIKDVALTQLVVGKPIGVTCYIVNAGKTPAYKIKIAGATKIGGTGLYEKEFRDFLASAIYLGQAICVSGLELSEEFMSDKILKESEMVDIQNGRCPVFCSSDIIYQDNLGCRHFMRCCYAYRFDTKKFYIYGNYCDAN